MNQEILNRYLAGDAVRKKKQMVAQWLDADPQHMREYLALRKLYDITLWQEKPATVIEGKKRFTLPFSGRIIKIAAIFLIALPLFISWRRKEGNRPRIWEPYMFLRDNGQNWHWATEHEYAWIQIRHSHSPTGLTGKSAGWHWMVKGTFR